MFYVYVLIDKNNKIYIGYSSDLKKRMRYHKAKRIKTTKNFVDLKLFYYEAYLTQKCATEREGKLKQFGSSYQGLIRRIGLRK